MPDRHRRPSQIVSGDRTGHFTPQIMPLCLETMRVNRLIRREDEAYESVFGGAPIRNR